METRGFVRSLACVAALALLASLSACDLMPGAPPEMTAAVDQATDEIRRLDGVSTVTSDISLWNAEDDRWRAHITVQARDSGVDLRTLAASVKQSSAIGAVPTTTILRIPGENGVADAQLTFSALAGMVSRDPDEMADATLNLRALDGAQSVSVTSAGDPATVLAGPAASMAGLTVAIRSLPGFGADALSAVYLTMEHGAQRGAFAVTFDALSPPADLVGFLDDLSRNPDVQSVTFSGVDTRRDSAAWRPVLEVETSTSAQAGIVASLLTTLNDSVTTAEGVPRASFAVSAPEGSSSQARTGYLGLPPGSAEPDDRTAGTPGGVPVQSVDPGDTAAHLDRDTAMIGALLDSAGDIAGIRGPATVIVGVCATGAGQQVQGSVVIPVFEIADSAGEAFDAITADWETQRFTKSDHAMGTDFYAAPDDTLHTLSIRGTADGISITATAPCVVTP